MKRRNHSASFKAKVAAYLVSDLKATVSGVTAD